MVLATQAIITFSAFFGLVYRLFYKPILKSLNKINNVKNFKKSLGKAIHAKVVFPLEIHSACFM